MKLSKEKIKLFQSIYSKSYGVHICEEKAEIKCIEIMQLLKTIININYKK